LSRILVAVTPLVGHVNPMLQIGKFLSTHGHNVTFNTSDLFRERVEGSNLRFLPLLGNANYDYHRLGELIPELREAKSASDQINCYLKHLFGDRIRDQYLGIQQAIDTHAIDLVMTDIDFLGSFHSC
jgi:hypothetical protein